MTLPLFDDVPAIASGLEPETGGTFRIFNYPEYNGPDVLKAFGKKYGVKVEVTTFTTMDEAVAKLRTGGAAFDIFFPTTDVVGKTVQGKLLQPVNPSYVTGLKNVWPQLQSPFYDVGSQYTVPYTVYTTGIMYRADKVDAPTGATGGYDLLWDEAFKGKAWLLDDKRETLAMAMLRGAMTTDVNTEDPAVIAQAQQSLSELVDLVNIKLGITAYTLRARGRRHGLPGVVRATRSTGSTTCPKGADASRPRLLVPAGRARSRSGSDTIAIPADAAKPVLAHHFLDYMLQPENAVANFGYTGYQPPQNTVDPDVPGVRRVHRAQPRPTVVRPEDYATAQSSCRLSPQVTPLWDTA